MTRIESVNNDDLSLKKHSGCRAVVFKMQYSYIFVALTRVISSPMDEYSILSLSSQDSKLAKLVLPNNEATTTSPTNSVNVRLDCYSQRQKSLSRRTGGDLIVYIPACSSKNTSHYQQVQCHEQTRYCWCVHIDTGEPIPGTTSLIDKPRCPEEKLDKRKPKQRCAAHRRLRFLRRLVSSLETELIMAGNVTNNKIDRDAALIWKFNRLDKNKNKVLEKSEWRPYKVVLLQWKRFRTCSRSLFKTCDNDGNKKLTQNEWKSCIAKEVNWVPAKRPEQLNPFLYVLKAE
ncbi:unnamed protein product [Auanema sp. JU1783]|nr:unnamed protein product [Auanema sp. JU1783]